MARLVAGFIVFVAILALINITYPGRIALRYMLILFIVGLLLLSSSQIAYLLGAVGDPTITKQAQTGQQGATIAV